MGSYVHMNYKSPRTKYATVFFLLPEMGVWAGLGKATSQMVEVSLAKHAVLEEDQLPEEDLRHLSQ